VSPEIAVRFLRDRRRSLLWWSVGVVGVVLLTVSFYPSIRGQQSFEDVYADLPDALKAMIGAGGEIAITSAPGYLQARLFGSLLPLLLMIFAIGVGTRALAGSEEDGTLELLLANPVTRRRVVAARLGATVTLVVGLGLVAAGSLLVLSPPFGVLDGVKVGYLVQATTAAVALALLHGALAFGVGCASGRRSHALGVATTVAVAGYLVQGLLSVSTTGHSLRVLSPWHWYLGRNILIEGAGATAFLLPLLVSTVVVAAGAWVFLHRDLR
jgi:ABC-2 type transport system permease protein